MVIFLSWLLDFRFPRINSPLSILRYSLDTPTEVSDKPSDFHEDHFRALKKGKVCQSYLRFFCSFSVLPGPLHLATFNLIIPRYNSSILLIILYKFREHNPGSKYIFDSQNGTAIDRKHELWATVRLSKNTAEVLFQNMKLSKGILASKRS